MNKTKTVFWVVIFGIILLIFFQNDTFFLGKQSLRIFKYHSPEVHNAVIFLAFFLAGLLISYFLGLPERFRLKKTIKKLTAQIVSSAQSAPSPEPAANTHEKSAVDAEPVPEKTD